MNCSGNRPSVRGMTFFLCLLFEQEALAYGEEGMLVLQEALERTVDAAKGLLERVEAAATEAEGGEVGTNACV